MMATFTDRRPETWIEGWVRVHPPEPITGQGYRAARGWRRIEAALSRVDDRGRPIEEKEDDR